MATKAIVKIDPARRRWLSEEEAIGWLNISRPLWDTYFKPELSRKMGGNYDKQQLDRLMERLDPLVL